jgi:Carboxypeptidase regulatory-like domain
LAVGMLAVVVIVGCRRGVPAPDTGPKPVSTGGTISGTIRGPERARAIEGRTVEIISIETNERQRVTTNSAGGFTFNVKPGKYRVELALRDGEKLVKQPGVMNINRSGVDAHADFVIGGRDSRPRGTGPRTDTTLGSPIA